MAMGQPRRPVCATGSICRNDAGDRYATGRQSVPRGRVCADFALRENPARVRVATSALANGLVSAEYDACGGCVSEGRTVGGTR
jgi:hypothetical protein